MTTKKFTSFNIKKVITQSLSKGFTLIELLVVISILGIIATFVITNVAGARSRAQDAKKKAELNSLKTALQLYYNKFQTYPINSSPVGLYFMGCGPSGVSKCPYAGCSSDFAAGGASGCDNIFMQRFEKNGSYFVFKYYQCAGGDDYRAKVILSNLSDVEIAESQLRCPAACGTTYNSTNYIICPN